MKDLGPFIADRNTVYSLRPESTEICTSIDIHVERVDHGSVLQHRACLLEARELAIELAALLNAREDLIVVLQAVQAQQPTLEAVRVAALLTNLVVLE